MKNKKVLIIGIILTVVICAVALGVLYFTTDLFKTEQQLFYKYLAQTEIIDYNFISQSNIANDRITKNSNSSSANLNFSTVVPNQEMGADDVQNIFTVKSNGLLNYITNQSYRDFTLSQNNQNVLTLRYLRDGNAYAIGADNILAKYLAVENSNLKDLFTKVGVKDVSQIPDSIPTNYKEILKIDEDTLNKLKETYGTLIYNNISKENFYKIANKDKTEEIGVSLTEQEVYNLLKLILETAKNDTVLLNLIINKAQLLNYDNITIENIQSLLQEKIDDISNQTYSNDKDFFKLSLVKRDKKVIKLNIETNITQITKNENSLIEENIESHEKQNNEIEIDFSETNKLLIFAKENDIEIMKFILSYSYNDRDINYQIETESKEEEKNSTIIMQYQIKNYQSDNITQNLIVEFSSSDEEEYQVNIANNITLKQDVIISKLTTENSAKLNDMTSEELGQLFIALINRITTVYGDGLVQY